MQTTDKLRNGKKENHNNANAITKNTIQSYVDSYAFWGF